MGVRKDDPGFQALAVVGGRRDLVDTRIIKIVRPALETIVVYAARIVGLCSQYEVKDVLRHKPILARYAFQKPRTDASVTRLSLPSAEAPPISRIAVSPGEPAMPRWTKPPTQPSSIEMNPAGPTRLACLRRTKRCSG